jgi:hypothetical protein
LADQTIVLLSDLPTITGVSEIQGAGVLGTNTPITLKGGAMSVSPDIVFSFNWEIDFTFGAGASLSGTDTLYAEYRSGFHTAIVNFTDGAYANIERLFVGSNWLVQKTCYGYMNISNGSVLIKYRFV